MNKHDRDNLNFILSLDTAEQWDEWAETLSQSDLLYALDLIRQAKVESLVQLIELQESVESEELDCTQALDFINRVKKGVSQ
jgi:hypothetical protein